MIKAFKRILCAVAVMASQSWAADKIREPFVGNDEKVYYLRHANLEDIDNPIVNISEGLKQNRKNRIENNYFGVLIVEDENRQYCGKMTAGRILLAIEGYSAGTITKAKTITDNRVDRFSIVADFYDWVLRLHDMTPEHEENVKFGENPGILIHRNIHAATVYIPVDNPLAEEFNTTAMLDAFAKLAQQDNYKVAPDTSMNINGEPITIEAGFPSFIISESRPATLKSENSPSNVFCLPYYDASAANQGTTQGMRYMTATSMNDITIPDLPEELSNRLATYIADNSILN